MKAQERKQQNIIKQSQILSRKKQQQKLQAKRKFDVRRIKAHRKSDSRRIRECWHIWVRQTGTFSHYCAAEISFFHPSHSQLITDACELNQYEQIGIRVRKPAMQSSTAELICHIANLTAL